MARETKKLSPAEVAKLVRAKEPGLFGDGAGLALRIGRGGAASWVLRYMRQGKAHEMGLGAIHTFGLAEARERALRYRQELHDGIDPVAARREARKAATPLVTFRQVAEMYIAAHAPTWKNAAHRRQWSQTLDDYVLPVIGGKGIAAIDTGDVMQVIEPLWHVKPETASRTRGRIETVLDYAAARQWRQGANPAAWRGHLANLLPAPHKVASVQHHPAMPWQDLPAFMAALAERQGMAAKALAFLILTGARSAEARGATWGELDLGAGIWTIPASRMKGAREHRVPLAEPALALLRSIRLPEAEPGALVFPGASGRKPISDVALAKLLPADATCHGFRSAFRTWAGETTGYPREVIEMALAHRLGDAVEQAYARGDLFQKRRRLMADWAEFCSRPMPSAGEVVTLAAGRAGDRVNVSRNVRGTQLVR